MIIVDERSFSCNARRLAGLLPGLIDARIVPTRRILAENATLGKISCDPSLIGTGPRPV